ncbi:MAG: hypothetical protein A2Y10_18300 [Planctomycetes bacterium GWF2_41_51]|nr:MAG: hypothetical protein A2Y10_18300 [Planctomycetes bacterium GWF2_41_51]HBG27939.1 hypothetical protein [Phycisphaerales bacterium]
MTFIEVDAPKKRIKLFHFHIINYRNISLKNFKKSNFPAIFSLNGTKNPNSQTEYEHDQMENILLKKMRTVTSDYQLPANPSETLKHFMMA